MLLHFDAWSFFGMKIKNMSLTPALGHFDYLGDCWGVWKIKLRYFGGFRKSTSSQESRKSLEMLAHLKKVVWREKKNNFLSFDKVLLMKFWLWSFIAPLLLCHGFVIEDTLLPYLIIGGVEFSPGSVVPRATISPWPTSLLWFVKGLSSSYPECIPLL